MQTETLPFSFEQWNNFLNEYKAIGMPSLHHSEAYRNQEVPAYRIVKKEWIDLLPILEKIPPVLVDCEIPFITEPPAVENGEIFLFMFIVEKKGL